MIITLILLISGIAFFKLIFPKLGSISILPLALAISSAELYFINVILYLNTSLNYKCIALISLFILISQSLLVFYYQRTNFKHIYESIKTYIIRKPLIVLGAILFYVLLSYWTPYGWDAITLHDFRSNLILNRYSFNQMLELSSQDKFNPTYYLSYPPFIAFVHAFYYSLSSNPTNFHLFSHICVSLLVYLLLRSVIDNKFSSILGIIYFFNPIMIEHTGIGYTNLPYTYFYISLIYFIFISKYKLDIKNIFIIGLLTSVLKLIRYTDPFNIIPILIITFLVKDKIYSKTLKLLILLLFTHVLTLHWSNIIKMTNGSFLGENILSLIIKLYQNKSVIVAANLIFVQKLITHWLLILFTIPLAIYNLIINRKKLILLLSLNVLLVLFVTYIGTMLAIIQLPGRPEITDSLNRIFMFILPITWVILGSQLTFKNKNI